ncbi:MAG: hypothetical protein SCJ93_08450 [Bacillota bacterium]|nr:hypothetical protein [Bacillota bacterium]
MKVIFRHLGAVDDLPSKIIINDDRKYITVDELIDKVSKISNKNLRDEILENEKLKEGLVIMTNGYSIEAQEGLKTKIFDENEVLLTVILFGG